MLPWIKQETVDWVNISTIEWNDKIMFIDNENYVWSFLWDVYDLLSKPSEENKEWSFIEFDDERMIYDLWWNTFLMKYKTDEVRDLDIVLFRNNFKSDWFYSELLEDDLHFPFVWCYFNYNDIPYIIIDWKNKMIWPTNIYSYKWLIINPMEYLNWSKDKLI